MRAIVRQGLVLALGVTLTLAVLFVSDVMQQRPAVAQDAVGVQGTVTINAGAPHFINYQGQLYNPNTNQPFVNDSLSVRFTIYRDAAGTQVAWQEDKFVATNADGFFNTALGDTNPFPDPYTIFKGDDLYLGVRVNNEELRPLQRIMYVPYAFWARSADKLGTYGARDFPKIKAYGVVNDDGSRASGSNFSSSRQLVGGEFVYVLDINGVNHSINDYTSIITPACNRPVHIGVGSSQGDLVVDVWDTSGARTTCRFEVLVLERN
jgi:hypothetical protein